ncbi:FAD-linked oxidoreductase-like protein [Dactylonectria estremocensis]|uniref:Proline dehydrogenase n=1 Tax=Dactylonectria estremocensis TaxID=1079267 RepID=A0A9P9DMM2_9HYPO|nr:FAD-linked oxidoreductase-like protein [Dactylonectria estremocensis]
MSLARSRGTCRPLRWAASPYTILDAPTSSISIHRLRPCLASTSHRRIHSSQKRDSTIADVPVPDPLPPSMGSSRAPLSVLSLTMILRSLATTVVSSSPVLLPPSLRIMDLLANSSNPVLNPDRNPLLRLFLKKTFYAQFCAGENALEVRRTIDGLKNIGFTGVLLCYAKEVVLTSDQAKSLGDPTKETQEAIDNEILPWAEGTMETVRLVQPGDYVALKFTGAGSLALGQLKARLPATTTLHKCIDDICQLAQQRGVRLLFDAEQDMLQDGIDDWTIEFARKYNGGVNDPVIYGTYQAYKKCAPAVLSNHLALAQKDGFSLGVKLVRGAYLGSDPRHLFHDTKEDTDKCYDKLAASVLTRQWSSSVMGEGEYPPSSLMIASHNAESVRRARAICDAGAAKSPVSFAQLQGMADEVSCELVEAGQAAREDKSRGAPALPAYKYLVWGTTGECMKYLLRRAQENKDAVQRTRDSRDAMWSELVRRCKSVVGLA